MFLNSAAKVYRVYAAFLHKHFFVMIFLGKYTKKQEL